MLKSLKKQAAKAMLPLLIVLAVILLGLSALLLPSAAALLRGPQDFDQYGAWNPDELEGKYVTVVIDNLIDSYAETEATSSDGSSEITSREYILPIYGENDSVFYIGVEVLGDAIADADAVAEDTYNFLSDSTGTYTRDDSYITVTGTIERMDYETGYYWRDYWETLDLDPYDDAFPNLVLVQGDVDSNFGMDGFIGLGIVWLLFLALFVWVLVLVLTGRFQKQIKGVIAQSADPESAEHALDLFYADTPADAHHLRMGRDWLLYARGASSWVMPGQSVTWIYPNVTKYRLNGIIPVGKTWAVTVCGDTEDKSWRVQTVPVKNEAAAQALMDTLHTVYPAAVCGYSAEREAQYRADPAAFRAAARQPAPSAQAEQPTQGE